MCTHLFRSGITYYLLRRIPANLVKTCGKSEIVQSLKTTNRAEALVCVRQLDVDLDLRFAQTRLGIDGSMIVDTVGLDLSTPCLSRQLPNHHRHLRNKLSLLLL